MYTSTMNNRNHYSSNGDSGSAIPYHARENSLPFSYGQIGGAGGSSKMSNTMTTYKAHTVLDSEKQQIYNNNNNINNKSNGRHNGYRDSSAERAKLDGEGNLIKAQPRLTSPLLVRKTLKSSLSPTRSSAANTNTISNTYHYKYNTLSGNNDERYAGSGRTAPTTNVGLEGSYGSSSLPIRADFEDLLRERREKVMHEYRSTMPASRSVNHHRVAPIPPQRHSKPQLLYNNNFNGTNSFGDSRRAEQQSKYTYDIEFNMDALNLDEWQRPHSSSAMKYNTLNLDNSRQQPVERNYYGNLQAGYNGGSSRQRDASSAMTTTTMSTTRYEQNSGNHMSDNEYSGNSSSNNYRVKRHADEVDFLDSSRFYATNSNAAPNKSNATSSKLLGSSNEHAVYQQQQHNHKYSLEPNFNNSETYLSTTTTTSLANSGSNTLASRPETPAFPVTPRSQAQNQHYGTVGNGNSSSQFHFSSSNNVSQHSQQRNLQVSPLESHKYEENIYQTIQRGRNAAQTTPTTPTTPYQQQQHFNSTLMSPMKHQEVAAHLVKFAKDSSGFWYKPALTRDEAIALLLHAEPGTFVVRDSTTYKEAYGLVVRVAKPPAGTATGKLEDLVRHYLIEPTARGVHLKGCANEPEFTSLSALIYQHSINQMSLPCVLKIPNKDVVHPHMEPTPAQRQLLTQGAACNVLWLYSSDTESLTGDICLRKTIAKMLSLKPLPAPTEVHFKVSQHGITITDITRKKFFRCHYPTELISYCAIDPDNRLWTLQSAADNKEPSPTVVGADKKTIFAVVARRSASSKDNQCHVFCDLAISQPASAIVSFINKTLLPSSEANSNNKKLHYAV